MATLFVRDVPAGVYEDLRSSARREGVSINAMVLRILEETAERARVKSDLAARLQEISARIDLPAAAPRAEELIREGRDERERHALDWT